MTVLSGVLVGWSDAPGVGVPPPFCGQSLSAKANLAIERWRGLVGIARVNDGQNYSNVIQQPISTTRQRKTAHRSPYSAETSPVNAEPGLPPACPEPAVRKSALAPAVATLAETAALPVEIIAVPEGRYARVVETAAYLLIAEGLDDAAHRDASHANVDIVQDGEWLMVTVEDDGGNRTSEFVEVADRVGALDGRLRVEPTRLWAELPCG